MQHTFNVPQASFHVLKALLLLLGKAPDDVMTWKHVQGCMTNAVFSSAASFDVTAPRDMEVNPCPLCFNDALKSCHER